MRVLFASTRGAGHVGPLVPFAQAAQRAGHDVLVAAPASAAAIVARAGLSHGPVGEAPAEVVEAALWNGARGPEEVIRDVFVGCTRAPRSPGCARRSPRGGPT